MKCWDENSLRSIAALICTSAKCARNLGTRARRITSRRSAAPGIFLRWRGLRVKTEPNEKPVSQNFSFVLDRASAVSGTGHIGYGRFAAGPGNLFSGSVAVAVPE